MGRDYGYHYTRVSTDCMNILPCVCMCWTMNSMVITVQNILTRATVRCRLRLVAIIITSNYHRLFTVFTNSIFIILSITRYFPHNIVLALQADYCYSDNTTVTIISQSQVRYSQPIRKQLYTGILCYCTHLQSIII